MNVHVNQIIGGIYGLALMERLKNRKEEYPHSFMAALPTLMLPSAMQYYEPAKKVFFVRNQRVHQYRTNCLWYPKVPWGEKKGTPCKDIDFLGKEMDMELFQIYNFPHSGYHLLKTHLLIRQELYKAISYLVKPKKSGEKMVYQVLHDGTMLTAEEMEKEISIFEEAVLIYIADVMQRRYSYKDSKTVNDFCYEQIKKISPNISDVWVDEMLKAISLPDTVREKLVKTDYTLNFESKMIGSLAFDVAKFVSRAYTLIYPEVQA